MRFSCTTLLLAVCCQLWLNAAIHVPLKEYAGATFFDGWDYWGDVDNTTWGNVTYLDRTNATTTRLTYVNPAGNAIIRVDNTTTITDAPLVHRNSIRLTSKDAYGVGTVWIIDAVHLPYGCSVWPSFWSLGQGAEWPGAGEIDIIEGINMMDHNQIALHSRPGCMKAEGTNQSGSTLETDCSLDRGCIVAERKPNSFGAGFAQAGGGVYAVQMDISGVFVWFWSRPDIPADIKSATSTSNIDTSAWGMPTASYPASTCNVTDYFGPQQLVLLITLCGDWAGVPSLYSSTCPGNCISDNIIGAGSPKYDNAYFEIPYIRTYILESQKPPPSTSSSAAPSTSSSGSSGSTPQTTLATNNNNAPRPTSSGVRTIVSNVATTIWIVLSLSAQVFRL